MRKELAVLAEPSFRRLYIARTVSLFGSSLAPLALAFAILETPGGSAAELGLVLGVRIMVVLVLLLFGGVLADRLSRYRLLIGSDLIASVGQGALAAMFLTQTAPLLGLLAAACAGGVAEALFGPAIRGAVPQVVPEARRQSANALLRLSRSATSIAGAPIAGVLVATVGAGWALAVDALSFLVSALLLIGIHVPKNRPRLPAGAARGF
jgi:MFS family permease